jgi:hypothetical protein
VVINTDKEDPPALIDEDREFGERLIASVRVAADNFEGDGVSGMQDPNLYTVTGETRRFMEMSSSQVMPTLTKKVLARKGEHQAGQGAEASARNDSRGAMDGDPPVDSPLPDMRYPRVKK